MVFFVRPLPLLPAELMRMMRNQLLNLHVDEGSGPHRVKRARLLSAGMDGIHHIPLVETGRRGLALPTKRKDGIAIHRVADGNRNFGFLAGTKKMLFKFLDIFVRHTHHHVRT